MPYIIQCIKLFSILHQRILFFRKCCPFDPFLYIDKCIMTCQKSNSAMSKDCRITVNKSIMVVKCKGPSKFICLQSIILYGLYFTYRIKSTYFTFKGFFLHTETHRKIRSLSWLVLNIFYSLLKRIR